MIDLSSPVLWAALGAGLMLAELLLPGFLMLGFGLAALAMALVVALLPASALEAANAELMLLLAFALGALAAWWALSRLFGRRARRNEGDADVNDFDSRH